MKTCLTIAGSDSCGGAGIQADIKTMTMNGVYAMSAITALTAQNTVEVMDIMAVEEKFLEKQIEAVVTDIFPDSVKIGMLVNKKLSEVVFDAIEKYSLKNIVLDPVMISSSGTKLVCEEVVEFLQKRLFPKCTVITPNIPESEVLTGIQIKTREDMEKASKIMFEKYGCAVLCKGGHKIGSADDYLCSNSFSGWFYGERINNTNTHGTGCTLSSAIAANLAKGMVLDESVMHAKEYITGAIKAMLDLGKGSGPLLHSYKLFC